VRWLPLVPEHFRTDVRLDALLWGCVAALIFSDEAQAARLRAGYRQWMCLMAVACGVLCVVLYSYLTSLWLAILIPAILAGTASHPEWAISRMLETRWLAFIGRASYSLYLWQQVFLISDWDNRLWIQKAPWNLLATAAVALASYYFLEKPCIALGRKLSAGLGQSRKPAGMIVPRRIRV